MTLNELHLSVLMASLYDASKTGRYSGLQVDRYGRTARMKGRRVRVVSADAQGSVEVLLSDRLVRYDSNEHANSEILRYLSR